MADPSRLAAGTAGADAPTEDLPLPGRRRAPTASDTQPGVPMPPGERGSITRLFGSRLYFRLWLAQFTSSLGDWIGFVAITAISNRIAGTNGVALVLSARLVPGFFLGSVGGLLADRLDRKKVMVACDIGRGVVIGLLPFVHTLPLLFLINLVLEALTLLWTPAKEATVPNLVREEQLPRVNSLGLAAAYGTFPLGAGLFTALAAVAAYLGRFDALSALRVNQENLAIWTDMGTYLISACLISTLAIPRRDRPSTGGKVDLGQGVRDVREGWRFIRQNAVVRSVMLALSCGLIGGGMVVPLGPDFASDVLGGGPRAFGALITAMGVGVALGVIGVSSVQSRLRPEGVFVQAVLLAGVCLIGAASMWALTPALLLVAALGVGGGAVYVFGFSLVQSHTEDEMRGRIFSALYASVRLCLVLSFVLGPLLSSLLDRISRRLVDNEVGIGGWHVALPGSRLALWLAGAIILGAGLLARRSLRAEGPRRSHPSRTGPRSSPGPAPGQASIAEALVRRPSEAGGPAEGASVDPGPADVDRPAPGAPVPGPHVRAPAPGERGQAAAAGKASAPGRPAVKGQAAARQSPADLPPPDRSSGDHPPAPPADASALDGSTVDGAAVHAERPRTDGRPDAAPGSDGGDRGQAVTPSSGPAGPGQ